MTEHPEIERIFCDLRAALTPPPGPTLSEVCHMQSRQLKRAVEGCEFYRGIIRTQLAMLDRAADALRAYFDADLTARHVCRDIERNNRAANVALRQFGGPL
jgi:hypothetical protein